MKRSIEWGTIWKKTSENLDEVVAGFWPSMGRKWSDKQVIDDIKRAKENGDIGKTTKPQIYKVVLIRAEALENQLKNER